MIKTVNWYVTNIIEKEFIEFCRTTISAWDCIICHRLKSIFIFFQSYKSLTQPLRIFSQLRMFIATHDIFKFKGRRVAGYKSFEIIFCVLFRFSKSIKYLEFRSPCSTKLTLDLTIQLSVKNRYKISSSDLYLLNIVLNTNCIGFISCWCSRYPSFELINSPVLCES